MDKTRKCVKLIQQELLMVKIMENNRKGFLYSSRY